VIESTRSPEVKPGKGIPLLLPTLSSSFMSPPFREALRLPNRTYVCVHYTTNICSMQGVFSSDGKTTPTGVAGHTHPVPAGAKRIAESTRPARAPVDTAIRLRRPQHDGVGVTSNQRGSKRRPGGHDRLPCVRPEHGNRDSAPFHTVRTLRIGRPSVSISCRKFFSISSVDVDERSPVDVSE
jgi:hypothetical protein